MAVHVPLSAKSQEEATGLMMAAKNLLRPADGSPITLPNKEMALGIYYLTSPDDSAPPYENIFEGKDEVTLAVNAGKIAQRQRIKVKIGKEVIHSTPGRIIFNQQLPSSMRFINETIGASTIKRLISATH